MNEAPYAVCCKGCGNVESFAFEAETGKRTTEPLTPRGRVPIYCQKCGARNWQVPATADQMAKFEDAKRREARATELCGSLSMDGLLKIPDEVRAAPEVKNAISNLLASLEGETLKRAQENCVKVARSGVQVSADMWVDLYDKAVQKAVQYTKGNKVAA